MDVLNGGLNPTNAHVPAQLTKENPSFLHQTDTLAKIDVKIDTSEMPTFELRHAKRALRVILIKMLILVFSECISFYD